jgi:hypothetical protein
MPMPLSLPLPLSLPVPQSQSQSQSLRGVGDLFSAVFEQWLGLGAQGAQGAVTQAQTQAQVQAQVQTQAQVQAGGDRGIEGTAADRGIEVEGVEIEASASASASASTSTSASASASAAPIAGALLLDAPRVRELLLSLGQTYSYLYRFPMVNMHTICIEYICVVSVYMQYNCVYYCDTCYIHVTKLILCCVSVCLYVYRCLWKKRKERC